MKKSRPRTLYTMIVRIGDAKLKAFFTLRHLYIGNKADSKMIRDAIVERVKEIRAERNR